MKHLTKYKLFESDHTKDEIGDILLEVQDDGFYTQQDVRKSGEYNVYTTYIFKTENCPYGNGEPFNYHEVAGVIDRVKSYLDQEGLVSNQHYTIDVVIPGFKWYNLDKDEMGWAKDVTNPNDTTGASEIVSVRVSYML